MIKIKPLQFWAVLGFLELIFSFAPDAIAANDELLIAEASTNVELVSSSVSIAADDGDDAKPPLFLVLPFVVLLLMIATGPLFYSHHWHHHYPKYALGLGVLTATYYLVVLHTSTPILHAMEEYFAFIALLAALYIASGGILISVNRKGTPAANAALLLFGSIIANVIGTTGASMLLIRPYMRLNGHCFSAF